MIEKGKTKLLSICTSFRRPGMLKTMLESFYVTRTDESTDIFIYLHDDDPHIEEYKEYISAFNHVIGPHKTLQEVINNTVFDRYPEIDNYQIICDDHLYHTRGWDKLLVSALNDRAGGWGFACGRDLINGDDWEMFQHPSAEIWSWKMVKLLGYVYPFGFRHQGIDFYTKDLSLSIGRLTFVPEVVIEHLWYSNCGKPPDQNILEKYDEDSMRQAYLAFGVWKEQEKSIAIEKINDAIKKEEELNNG